MILFYKDTGLIFKKVIPDQPIDDYLFHYSEVQKNNVGVLYNMDEINIRNKVFQNGKIRDMTNLEINEMSIYGRFLTEEERILESMKPSIEEIRKAEKTIELLSLLEGVL